MGLLFISLYNTYSFGKYNSTMLKRTLLILQLSAWCCMKVLLLMLLASVTAGMSRRNLYTPLYTRRSTLYPSPSRLHLEAWRTRALIMCLRKSFHEWNLPPRRKTSLRIDSYSLSAAYFQYSILYFSFVNLIPSTSHSVWERDFPANCGTFMLISNMT